MRIFAALFFVAAIPAAAQKVEVPHKLDFGGITLIIRDDARREIQKDVDALTASYRHYMIKVERARTYFPIIEKIFREEGLPDDFKFLVLQESALIADAVSTSNAVGFWQFKDFTGIEMGLRIDKDIDERLNIAASSRAAARYIIKNNQYFNNWIYALQSYQMGAGGVMKSVKNTEPNATRMDITGKTYWYVKKFLAHKIAYEGAVKGTPQNQVVVFENRGRTTLQRLAKEIHVEEDALRELNKWTKSGVIPDDRKYVVLLPVEGASATTPAIAAVAEGDRARETRVVPNASSARARGQVNGVHTIQAVPGDNARKLAAITGVDYPKFIKWNDLQTGDEIVAGQVYFLKRKRLKGSEAFHKLAPGESMWQVSQKYGITMKRLKRYNRIDGDMEPAAGTMLYLASRRPKEDAVMARVENAVEVNDREAFSWAVATESAGEEVTRTAPVVVQAPAEPENAPLEVSPKASDSLKILQTSKTEPTLEDTPSASHVAIPPDKLHIVQAGETLYGIARMYDVAVMELVSLNELRLQEGIKPGQTLKLAGADPQDGDLAVADDDLPVKTFFHQVKTSDTLYSIARQYNVTIKQIMEWNEKKDFALAVGEKLRISPGQ